VDVVTIPLFLLSVYVFIGAFVVHVGPGGSLDGGFLLNFSSIKTLRRFLILFSYFLTVILGYARLCIRKYI